MQKGCIPRWQFFSLFLNTLAFYQPFPSVEQILLPDTDEDVAVLDVEEDYDQPYGIKFEDQDWDQYLALVV